MPRFLSLLLLLALAGSLNAARLTGLVTDTAGTPLPFANVEAVPAEGPPAGCATNGEGRFTLDLPAGRYTLVVRYVGYATLREAVDLDPGGARVELRLTEQALRLDDVVVRGDEDPAAAILRRAVARREKHRTEARAFSVDAYVKALQRVEEAPERVLGFRLDAAGVLDSSRSGIVYLSESVSRLHVLRQAGGNRTREDMTASKVSGDDQAFSFNEAAPMELDVYLPRVTVPGLSERAFVSPLAGDAFFFYRFRLLGTFYDEGRLVNRIAVEPRRTQDPVFRGTIDILEDEWRVHGQDLLLTRDAGIEFIDSLRWTMRYVPLPMPDDTVWLPASRAFTFRFGLLGIRGSGYFMAWYENWDLRPPFRPGGPEPARRFFGPEVLAIARGANERDSAYWAGRRPAPLSTEERADYAAKDSLEALREQPAYLDSLDRIENRPEPMNLLVGYAYRNSVRKTTWFVASPLERMAYNTVEGWTLGLEGGWQKEGERHRLLRLDAGGHYGLGNRAWMADASLRWSCDAVHAGVLAFGGGRRMIDYHPRALSRAGNTTYTLWLERNFLKLYEDRGGFVHGEREVANGLLARATLRWSERVPWTNWAGAAPWRDRDGYAFTSNDPVRPGNQGLPFERHRAATVDASLRYTIGQRYASEPDRRFRLGSPWPTLRLDYRGAFPVAGTDLRYDRLEGGLSQGLDFGLWGRSQLMLLAGGFPTRDSLSFVDFRHFGGNRTVFLPVAIDRYRVLPFYARSTTGPWIQAHAEHHFNGFFFNKLPGLRALRWQLVAGGHYLWTEEHGHYGELGIGIEHIFRVFRVEAAVGWGEEEPRFGVLFGLGF